MQTAPKALRGSANRNDWCIVFEFYRNYLLALDIARDEELAAASPEDHITRPFSIRISRRTMRIAGRARLSCRRKMIRDRPFLVRKMAIFEMRRRPCERGSGTEYAKCKAQRHQLAIDIHWIVLQTRSISHCDRRRGSFFLFCVLGLFNA